MNERNAKGNGTGLGSTAQMAPEVCRADPANTLTSPPYKLARGAHDSAQDFLAKLEKLMRGPQQQHCALEVCIATRASIEQVIRLLHKPSEQLYRWMEGAKVLEHQLQSKLGDTHESSRQNLKGKKTKHPVWVCYAHYGIEKPLNCATQILLGCAAILAFADSKAISRSLPGKLADLEALGPIDEQQFLALMAGVDYEETGANQSIELLKRLWIYVLQRFGNGQELPVSTPGETIRSQVVSSALNTSARHVAGAAHHRLLTMEQFDLACERMRADLEKPLLRGVLCYLVVRTGLSVEVVGQLPLATGNQPSSRSYLDVEHGLVVVDFVVVCNEASEPLAGSIEARHQLRVHLPAELGRRLRERLALHSEARHLRDLFPHEPVPQHYSEIFLSTGGFKCTWSRLRRTLGLFLRYQGYNKLLAGLLSGDFGINPRSKLHYAAVTASEFHQMEQQLHQRLGLGETVPLQEDEPGIGCAVVPAKDHIQLHDVLLALYVKHKYPGKSGSLASLRSFHNAYTRLVGWRLSVLLALRESATIEIDAGINVDHDTWVPLHDKGTRMDRGFQPVPLCDYVLMQIRLYREHCRAMAPRLLQLSGENTEFSLWCASVGRGQKVRLLSLVDDDNKIRGLPSRYFTSRAELQKAGVHTDQMHYDLAPDVGRKVMENQLRLSGARSSDIDAFLRHFTLGQEPASAFDPAVLSSSIQRISAHQQKVAISLLGPTAVGLSKGSVRRRALEVTHR